MADYIGICQKSSGIVEYQHNGSEENNNMVRFRTHTCKDEQVLMRDAFSMLVPEGWEVSGGLVWRQHPTMPAAISLCMQSPDRYYELRMFPSMPYCWNESPMGFFAPSEGSYYMGNEVRHPPQGFADYTARYLLPMTGGRILSSRAFPELEAVLRQENAAPFGCAVDVSAGVSQVEYTLDYEGEMICGIAVTRMMYGQLTWIADRLIMTRMPKMAGVGPGGWIFPFMLNSFKLDIEWYNGYYQHTQMLSANVMQGIWQAGVTSRIIANTYNQISDTVRRSYEYQQASNARVYQGYSEAMRGVNSYYDPYKGYAVEFPCDYRYVYANPLGEYIVTNDAGYNPNVGSNMNWTNLNR